MIKHHFYRDLEGLGVYLSPALLLFTSPCIPMLDCAILCTTFRSTTAELQADLQGFTSKLMTHSQLEILWVGQWTSIQPFWISNIRFWLAMCPTPSRHLASKLAMFEHVKNGRCASCGRCSIYRLAELAGFSCSTDWGIQCVSLPTISNWNGWPGDASVGGWRGSRKDAAWRSRTQADGIALCGQWQHANTKIRSEPS